ncbi:MAG: devS, partial [Frankiales bacterium]|nr:devS [Frankiales bacterium]
LHDLVIQRLFATGMALESTVRRIEPPEVADRVRRAVDDLDTTIKEIRSTIFALQSPAPLSNEGLRAAVQRVVAGAAPALGFDPRVTFDGPVDSVVPGPVAEQLVAVLREGLSNVARHAGATRLSVTVATGGDRVRVRLVDDGKGLPVDAARSGLKNLAVRARDVGGTFSAAANAAPETGTTVEWSAPLFDPA